MDGNSEKRVKFMTARKRFLSLFLSVLLCATSFFGMFSTSALAASSGSCGATGSSVNYSYDFPRFLHVCRGMITGMNAPLWLLGRA